MIQRRSFNALRAMCWINRFGTLPRVQRAFREVAAGTWSRRRLFGFEIDLDVTRSTAQQLLLVEGERFIEERVVLQRLLRPGMTVVDVGANIGYYLLLFERAVGPSGRVICIEPSDENLPELRQNIALNRLGNVELHEVALGDHDGEVRLEAGINSGVVEGDGGQYSAPLRRLDTLVSGSVDFLKIDVEGYEGQVLDGATAMISRHRPVLFLEVHPHIVRRFGYTSSAIVGRLAEWYRRITLYEKAQPKTGVAKAVSRYFGGEGLTAVDDSQSYIARYDDGSISHTYWAVCEP